MIFLNFKTYQRGTGEEAKSIVAICEIVSSATGVKIIPVVQPLDLKEFTAGSTVEIWSQKIDAVEFGAHTGSILPEAVVEDGAMGTFLNHSENRFADFETLAKAHDRAREVNLKTLIFAKDIEELRQVSSLTPDFISYEPPELIGSKDKSVASAQPEIITEAVRVAGHAGIPLIVGAGVHSSDDVRKSLELGATGIAVASDVMMAADPQKELTDLAEGFR
jgi:triosephosphate isomerase